MKEERKQAADFATAALTKRMFELQEESVHRSLTNDEYLLMALFVVGWELISLEDIGDAVAG